MVNSVHVQIKINSSHTLYMRIEPTSLSAKKYVFAQSPSIRNTSQNKKLMKTECARIKNEQQCKKKSPSFSYLDFDPIPFIISIA